MASINNVKSKSLKPIGDAEKLALCKRWKASKLPLKVFCKEYGVAKSSLYKWYKKYFSTTDVEATPSFIQLTPTPKQQNIQEKVSMELKLNNGTILYLNLLMVDMVILIQELNHAATVVR